LLRENGKMGEVKNRGLLKVQIEKYGESFDLQPYQNFPPIFHWAQAAPTRHRVRSHRTSRTLLIVT